MLRAVALAALLVLSLLPHARCAQSKSDTCVPMACAD
jgi:hypothetical protein